MSGLLLSIWIFIYISLWMFHMFEYSAGPPISGILVSLWIFSYVEIYCRSSYERFVCITVDVFLCMNILEVLL